MRTRKSRNTVMMMKNEIYNDDVDKGNDYDDDDDDG